MAMTHVLEQIDAEIAKLQQARALLAGTTEPKAGRGRPKGSKNVVHDAGASAAPAATGKKAKRNLSPEGRKAIADAMKRRWAAKRAA